MCSRIRSSTSSGIVRPAVTSLTMGSCGTLIGSGCGCDAPLSCPCGADGPCNGKQIHIWQSGLSSASSHSCIHPGMPHCKWVCSTSGAGVYRPWTATAKLLFIVQQPLLMGMEERPWVLRELTATTPPLRQARTAHLALQWSHSCKTRHWHTHIKRHWRGRQGKTLLLRG